MRNLTLHPPARREIALASEAGLSLMPQVEGVLCGEDGMEAAVECLAEKLAECRKRGEAALIGGMTALWVSAALQASQQGGLPPLYWMETAERGRGYEPVKVSRCW